MLHDGSLAIAFNNNSSNVSREKPGSSKRKPLTIALSQDGGETWPWVRDIETGNSAGGEKKVQQKTHEEYSYPSLLQDADGKINVAYTYNREAIKVSRFDEEWIKQGNTEGKFKGDSLN